MFARPIGQSLRVTSYMALMEACLEVLRGREAQEATPDAAVSFRAPGAAFRMDAALARIRSLLRERSTTPFSA